TAHYRSPLDFSNELLEESAAAYERLATFATNAARALHHQVPDGGVDEGDWRERFVAALDDDLNIPAALAVLHDLVSAANPLIAPAERGVPERGAELHPRRVTSSDLASRLGFTPRLALPEPPMFPAVLKLVLELRERARAARDFVAADLIRERLGGGGHPRGDAGGGGTWALPR